MHCTLSLLFDQQCSAEKTLHAVFVSNDISNVGINGGAIPITDVHFGISIN